MKTRNVILAGGALLTLVPYLLASRTTDGATSSVTPAPAAQQRPGDMPVRGRVRPLIASLSFAQYANASHEIVHGRILGERLADGAGFPSRIYDVQVLSAMKGLDRAQIQVVVGGADTPSGRYIVEGAPSFAAGDEAVLFLSTAPGSELYGIMGLEQGTYRVRTRADGQRVVDGLHASDEGVSAFLARAGDQFLAPAKR